MIKFELEGLKYQTPEGWNQVEFGKFLDYLSDVSPHEPKELKDFLKRHVEFIQGLDESLSEHDKNVEAVKHFNDSWERMKKKDKIVCYKYFAKSVGFWCGLDADVIEKSMNRTMLEIAFWSIQATLDLNELKHDESFTGFEIKGVKYTLPKKHMEGATVAEFAEAAQFQEQMQDVENGLWLSMLDVMVVLCRPRPKEEVYSYNNNRHELRKKLFRSLTMDVVANVCFFLHSLSNTLRSNLLIYGLRQMKEQREAQRFQKSMVGH